MAGVYRREAVSIGARLAGEGGASGHRIEHVGSTSVPGLPAKPVIDMLLIVDDPGDEDGYVPALTAAGYAVAVREPEWYEHRVLRKRDLDPSAARPTCMSCPPVAPRSTACCSSGTGCAHTGDRELYARTKRGLARQEWKYMQNYADAKTEVVEEILARARSAG